MTHSKVCKQAIHDEDNPIVQLRKIPPLTIKIKTLNIEFQSLNDNQTRMRKLNLDYDILVSFYDTGFPDEIGLKIELQRLPLKSFIEHILPPSLPPLPAIFTSFWVLSLACMIFSISSWSCQWSSLNPFPFFIKEQ